jgi:hypothetical protein
MSIGSPPLKAMIRQALYDLKHRYGDEVQVYRLDTAATNYETGAKTAGTTHAYVRKAIVMPSSEARRFFASISFISASKAFISPGQQGWDQVERIFIFDARDLPDTFQEIHPEDWVMYQDKRFEVVMVEQLDDSIGWMVGAKHVKGSQPERIIDLNVVDTLEVSDEAIET